MGKPKSCFKMLVKFDTNQLKKTKGFLLHDKQTLYLFKGQGHEIKILVLPQDISGDLIVPCPVTLIFHSFLKFLKFI